MAQQHHSAVSGILFKELTNKYEEISPEEISRIILQNGNDRVACIAVLERLSEECLYSGGESTSTPPPRPPTFNTGDHSIPPPRPPPYGGSRERHKSGGNGLNDHVLTVTPPPQLMHSVSAPYVSQHHAYVGGGGGGGGGGVGAMSRSAPPVPPPTYRTATSHPGTGFTERPLPPPPPLEHTPEHKQTEYQMPSGSKVTVTMGKPGTVLFPSHTTDQSPNRGGGDGRGGHTSHWQMNNQYTPPAHVGQQAAGGFGYYPPQQQVLPAQQAWPPRQPVAKPSHFHSSFPHDYSNSSSSPQHSSPGTPPPPRTLNLFPEATGSPVKAVSPLYQYPTSGSGLTQPYYNPSSSSGPAQQGGGSLYHSSVSVHVGTPLPPPAGSVHYPPQRNSPINTHVTSPIGYYPPSPINQGYPPQVPQQAWGAVGTPEGEHIVGRSRAGSVEDTQYIKTLLQYQREQHNKLIDEISASEAELGALKQRVIELNEKLVKRQRRPRSGITSADIQNLRDENSRLKMSITINLQKIDSVTSEHDAKYGWTRSSMAASTSTSSHTTTTTVPAIASARQQQSFYHNISPGPSGSFNSFEESEQLRAALALSRLESQHNTTTTHPIQETTPPSHTQHQRNPHPHHTPVSSPNTPTQQRPPFTAPSTTASTGAEGDEGVWSCGKCTFNNHMALAICEMCDMPREPASLLQSNGPRAGPPPTRGPPTHYAPPYRPSDFSSAPPSYDTVDSSPSPAAASSS